MRPALAILFLLSIFCSPSARAEQISQPNILLILADDVGQEALGCYGGESYPTPRLDRLAHEGVRFDYAFSMPVCHPTRLTLLTGKYPSQLPDAPWGSFPKSYEHQTIGHELKRAGYATAVAGKWQLTMLKDDVEHPHRLGFDEYCLFGWHEGPRFWQPHIRQNGKLRDDVKDRYGPDVYVDFLIDFMKAPRHRPFFALYSMALCHAVSDDLETPPPYGPGMDRYESFAEMVAQMDRMVGRLLDALDELDLSAETVVIFTTDNGSPSRSIIRAEGRRYLQEPVFSRRHGREVRGGKGSLTDAGTRVPLLARWPGRIPAGLESSRLVDFTDFYPTLKGLARGGWEKVSGQGFDFLETWLRADAKGSRPFARAEHKGLSWARTAEWKLYSDGRLFHMAEDPDEKNALEKSKETGTTARMRAELQAALREVRPRE